jgi:hypothetical protein
MLSNTRPVSRLSPFTRSSPVQVTLLLLLLRFKSLYGSRKFVGTTREKELAIP